jgi:hypothetical protein
VIAANVQSAAVHTQEGVTPRFFILDLFNNPVGYRTSLGKMLRILLFLAEIVQKLKFLNNSIGVIVCRI